MMTYLPGTNRWLSMKKSRAAVQKRRIPSITQFWVVSSAGIAQMAAPLIRPRKTSLRIRAGVPPNREISSCIAVVAPSSSTRPS